MKERIGFLGLGLMGQPMALNLLRAGNPLLVWNRSPERLQPLLEAGAVAAEGASQLLQHCQIVLIMLADIHAINAVLGRGEASFGRNLAGRTLVYMGTISPEDSASLHADLLAVGAEYLEVPVSGSRGPAEAGQLIAMLAGDSVRLARVQALLGAMCSRVVHCGQVPSALRMKLAVNLFLVTMVTGLAEAYHLAARQGLDLERLSEVLDQGPMASAVSRIKARKLLTADFTPQAALRDVWKNNRLIADAARAAGVASPLLDVCLALYGEGVALGHGEQDMVAVVHALQARD